MFRNQTSSPWSWSTICPFRLSAKFGIGRYLLVPNFALNASLSKSNSTTFEPLSQCSPYVPLKTTRAWLNSPTGFKTCRGPGRTDRRGRRMCDWVRFFRRVQVVVEDLILEAERRVPGRETHGQRLGHVVLDTAIRAGRDFPLELELEILVGCDRHDVSAFERLAVRSGWNRPARDLADHPVLDHPMLGGNLVASHASPTVEGLAVEKRPPVGGRSRCYGRSEKGNSAEDHVACYIASQPEARVPCGAAARTRLGLL